MSDVRKVAVYRDGDVLGCAIEHAVQFRCGACRFGWREWVEEGHSPPKPDCPRCGKNVDQLEEERAQLLARAEQAEQRVHELTHEVQCCELLERDLREAVAHLRAGKEQAERERDEARAERDVAVKEEARAKFNLDKAAEELRRRVERLEQLTGFVPKE